MRARVVVLLLMGFGFSPNLAWGQLEEDDFPPGLSARYAAGGKTIERIDPDVAFTWGKSAPDARLPEGPFTAEWQAELLVRKAGRYQMHAYLQGEVELSLDGDSTLAGRRDQPGWISSKPFDLRFGDPSLTVRFRKTAASAELRLYWSSESFPLEPLPTLLLFRDGADPKLNQRETGRTLFDSSRCNRCHRREAEELAPAAPALLHVADGVHWTSLVQTIHEPRGAAHARMPSFGFSREQAEQVAAYLWDNSRSVKLSAPKIKNRAEAVRAGQLTFRSVGCLACHTLDKAGHSGPFGGGDLSTIGQKRSAAWLYTWLKSPERLNPDHHMPVVKLTDAERGQLAVYLADQGRSEKSPRVLMFKPDQSAIDQGKQLVEAARCAACHRISNEEFRAQGLVDLSQPVKNWTNSCMAETPDVKRHRPAYPQLTPAEREALISYVESRLGRLSPKSQFDQGRLVLERHNCLACHERDRAKGIIEVAGQMEQLDEALLGQSQALIPPTLNAVGDKLLDQALAEAISGEQRAPRLPWLKVRMPRFQHKPEEKAALLTYLVGHDRIPDNAPSPHQPSPSNAASSEVLVAGHVLVGAKGFSCVACHVVGSFEPRNVALGTRGSDLLKLGKRMRKSFYLRWTHSPQRIVPGMEMPSYQKAVPKMLNDDLTAQLTATWDALNDPRFTAPTALSAVEQLLVVRQDEPARIVRDVFTNPQENGGGYVARAMAIGLNNGHSVLFDLDNFTLRQWTFGDFARQRTEGKSWYWDLAGIPVMNDFTTDSDFALQRTSQPNVPPIAPLIEQHARGRLLWYRNLGDGLEWAYELRFPSKNEAITIQVQETIDPISLVSDKIERSGWKRRLRFSHVPAGYEVLVARNNRTGLVGEPSVTSATENPPQQSEWVRAVSGKVELDYSATLTRPELELPPKPEVPTQAEAITTVPGFTGTRLTLPGSIMPTALTWTERELPSIPKGTLVFTSLKGHVFIARDTDGDGLEDSLSTFDEGLAAPYGVISYGNGLLVAHKPELVYLEDTDHDGRADLRQVVATGWGYSDNYHDWTTGIIRDSLGRFYIGLGSDYAQPKREKDTTRWRGDVLRVTPPSPPSGNAASGFHPWTITPVGHAFRYPTGLAITEDDQIFVTDNQGVQNTFNELNHLVEGRHYGVPSLSGLETKAVPTPPALQVPHPWTRSVNGLFFIPQTGPNDSALVGHGIGCEYDTRFLVRFSLQEVGGEYQGAAYPFSLPNAGTGGENFQGPLCGGVAPDGDLYVGSIYDSGWLGGRNTGDIVRLTPKNTLPNGIREVRATPDGFDVEFFAPVDWQRAARPENYDLSGYTRDWKGGYATPDSGRHKLQVTSATLSPDGRLVSLQVEGRREGFLYDVSCSRLAMDQKPPLFPDAAYYTLHKIPKQTEALP